MKSFWIAILLSLFVFIVYRYLLYTLNIVTNKLFSKSLHATKKQEGFLDSLWMFICFLMIYCKSIDVVSSIYKFGVLEWYVSYAMLGISSIIWCYCDWKADSLSLVLKTADINNNRYKKILVFTAIGIYTFWMGYEKINSVVQGTKLHFNFDIAQTSIVAVVIAVDRVINQIYSILLDRKKEKGLNA